MRTETYSLPTTPVGEYDEEMQPMQEEAEEEITPTFARGINLSGQANTGGMKKIVIPPRVGGIDDIGAWVRGEPANLFRRGSRNVEPISSYCSDTFC